MMLKMLKYEIKKNNQLKKNKNKLELTNINSSDS